MTLPYFNTALCIHPAFSREAHETVSRNLPRGEFFDQPYPRSSASLDPAAHCALPSIRSLELITPMPGSPIYNFHPFLTSPMEPKYYNTHRSLLYSHPSSFSTVYAQDSSMSSMHGYPSVEPYNTPHRHFEWPHHRAFLLQHEHNPSLPYLVPEGARQMPRHQSIDAQCDNRKHTVAETSGPSLEKNQRKQRTKRQCPECHDYFINISTHRAVHRKPAQLQVCEVCQRAFVRRNDLARHRKKHWQESGDGRGLFMCPFKKPGDSSTCSHATGAFSRCDTYKNHLKSIHFVCPAGTRKDARNRTNGTCGGCQQGFSGVDDWLNNHVKTKECIALNMP